MFEGALTTACYRCMIVVLADREECLRIARVAGHDALSDSIQPVLDLFERDNSFVVPLDRYGSSYTIGKRKESAAHVWMIPVHKQQQQSEQQQQLEQQQPAAEADDLLAPVVDDAFAPSPDRLHVDVTTSVILVNNVPLNKFFPTTVDRELVSPQTPPDVHGLGLIKVRLSVARHSMVRSHRYLALHHSHHHRPHIPPQQTIPCSRLPTLSEDRFKILFAQFTSTTGLRLNNQDFVIDNRIEPFSQGTASTRYVLISLISFH